MNVFRKKLVLIGLMTLFTHQTMVGMGSLQPFLPYFSASSTKIITGLEALKNYIQKNSSLIPFTIASSIAGAGLLYCLYKAKSPTKQEQVPLKKQDLIKSPRQIQVLLQKGDAYCGYHALKNALLFLEADRFNQDLSKIEDDNNFISHEYFDGKLQSWTEQIKKFRKRLSLKKYLTAEIPKYLKNYELPKDSSALTKTLFFIYSWFNSPAKQTMKHEIKSDELARAIAGLVEFAMDSVDRNEEYIIDATTFLSALNKKELFDETVVKQHFPNLKTLSIVVNNNVLDELLKKNKDFDSVDQWVESGEISQLIQFETNLKNIQDSITIIEYAHRMEETFDIEFTTIAQKFSSQSDAFHAFILGTMDLESQSQGHWFTFIIQKKDNHYQTFVTDSLGIDRATDVRVNKIIDILNSKLDELTAAFQSYCKSFLQ